MKRITLILLLIALPLHAQNPPSTAAIGIAVPTSGEYAPLGKQLVQAARLAARESGVRLVVVDTEGQPAKAVEAIMTLAKNPDVVAIVGPVGRRESRAAASAAQRVAVPLFTLSTSEMVNQAGSWVFRVRASPAEQAREMAKVARTTLKSKSAAVLYPQTPYGNEAALAFADEYLRRGGTVAAVANYPADTTDFAHVLEVIVGKRVYLGKQSTVERWRTDSRGFARIRKKAVVDFDTLFIPDFHTRVARVLPFLPVAGIQNGDGGDGVAVQLLGLAGWQGKAMELAGGVASGALYLDTFAGEAAGGQVEEFARTFEEFTGRRPVDIEAETFDITWLLGNIGAAALSAEKDVAAARAEVVRRLPVKDSWAGVAGGLRFGPSGAPERQFGVYRFDMDGAVAPAY